MKYDIQLGSLKSALPSTKKVLIAIPTGADIDKLAAGLTLYLSLEQQGKEVSIVCEDTIRVGQSHLFAIDKVKQTIPTSGNGGNLVLTLEGVEIIEENGRLTPKNLEKLDWYGERNNTLNLVFHVLPGQTFQPTKITPTYQGGGFDIVFVLGAQSLTNLGNLYNQNPQIFSNTHLVNIDYQNGNSSFGHTNVVDNSASSVSEIMVNVMGDLGLILDGDMATNLLAGIFDATSNLTNEKAGAETFTAVAQSLKAGGRKPQQMGTTQTNTQQPSGFDLSAFMPQNNTPVTQPTIQNEPIPTPQPVSEPQPQAAPTLSFDQFMNQPQPNQQNPTMNTNANMPSPEERPTGEATNSENNEFEPDWLTPKVFKGSSIG